MKRLYRSVKDKKISGVCAGMAEYFNIDVAIVRIIFLSAALFGGLGIVVYIICWICMPKENNLQQK